MRGEGIVRSGFKAKMTTGSQSPQPKTNDPDRDVRIMARLMMALAVVVVLGFIGLRVYDGLTQFQQMMTGWCEWSGGGQVGLPGTASDCGTWASQVMVARPEIVPECVTSLVDIQSFYHCMDQNAGPLP